MKEALEDDSGAFFMGIFKKTGLLKEPNRYSIIERRNIYLVKISLALEMRKTYICIDLKSFYASVECVARGLDPFSSNLVVADPGRGHGALCLAVSPAMKARGVRNRCRLFEIPPEMKYIAALPRMRRYMEVSSDIYENYLKIFRREDIYAYSIDECFIDVTSYLPLYRMNGRRMALFLMKSIFVKTGISSSAGIGSNMFLAKVAMDVLAKHNAERAAVLDEDSFKEEIWHHRPITDIWGIGTHMATRLAKYGIFDLYGITKVNESLLYKEFGKRAEYLIDHAYGREPCTISDIHSYTPAARSLSNRQVLFKDYDYESARLLTGEMAEVLIQQLLEKNLVAEGISLHVGYSGNERRGNGGSRKLETPTDIPKDIWAAFDRLYVEKVREEIPIRTVSLCLENVRKAEEVPRIMSLFRSSEEEDRDKELERVMIQVKREFGKNALLRGFNYAPGAMQQTRNGLVGGHHE